MPAEFRDALFVGERDTLTGDPTAVVAAAVALINAGGAAALTLPRLAHAVGAEEADLRADYGTVSDVFDAVITALGELHAAALDNTVRRRRSFAESLRIGFAAFFAVAEQHTDHHLAAKHILLHRVGDGGAAAPAAGTPMYEEYLIGTIRWLQKLEDSHSIRWELPLPQLAQLLVATLEGLTTAFLANPDRNRIQLIADHFAYQLAAYGRRYAKNFPR